MLVSPENKATKPDRTKAGLVVTLNSWGQVTCVRDAVSGHELAVRSATYKHGMGCAPVLTLEVIGTPRTPITFETKADG
jgi:hypothetical protein